MVGKRKPEWEQVFAPADSGLYEVRGEHWGKVDSPAVRALAPGGRDENRMMAGGLIAYPFLDGGVVFCEQVDPEAWSDDVVDDGVWVVGNAALRAVCEVAAIPQPDLLEGETAVPTVEAVMDAVRRGVLLMEDRDTQATAIMYTSEIRKLAEQASGTWLSGT